MSCFLRFFFEVCYYFSRITQTYAFFSWGMGMCNCFNDNFATWKRS